MRLEAQLGYSGLLLSDIVMPGMRGPELYEVVRTTWPDLPRCS